MSDTLGKFFLTFSHDTILIPLIILGSLWGKRDLFYGATFLILLSMIVNLCLKLTFQIPLSPTLGKVGFAFPSGHMQSSTIFYGWILYQTPYKILRLSLALLLGGIGLSLVYFGYHNFYDILGAVFFAILLIAGYQEMNTKIRDPFKSLGLILFASLGVLYIYLKSFEIPAHIWMAYYALLGFVSFSWIEKKEGPFSLRKSQKISATFFCCGASFLIYTLFQKPLLLTAPLYIGQLQWFFIGMMVPLSKYWILRLKLSTAKS